MNMSIVRISFFVLVCVLAQSVTAREQVQPLTFGETFTMQSEQLAEMRRINVFTPTVYGEPVEVPLPVLYMLDGGMKEDFLHIAGLIQVLVSNGSMRPFMLVGIENTERRRDMTGPSEDPEDRAMADRIGGADRFRAFVRDELIEEIERRFDVQPERAIIGESLAGLFVVETLAREPELFDTYIAVDPSVWWNRYNLNDRVAEALSAPGAGGRRLFIAASEEASSAERFQAFIAEVEQSSTHLAFDYAPMPEETHASLFHPAAMKGLRSLFPAEGDH